jgi:hypothetical protein
MKRIAFLLLLIGSAVAAFATEEAAPPTDCLGIYFDPEGSLYCKEGVLGEIEAYLILTNPSDTTGVMGWECRIEMEVPPGNYFAGFELPTKSINAATPPDFIVGLAECLPYEPTVHLATLKLVVLTSDRWNFYVRPPARSSLAASASYAPCADAGDLKVMYPANSRWDKPVAWLNGPCDRQGPSDKAWQGIKDQYE